MTLDTLFRMANYAVLPFWLLLMVAPRWRWTQLLVHGPVAVMLLTPIYAYLLFGYGPLPDARGMMTLYGLVELFSAPHLIVAGWIHYLIFDLFVGAWESRDALRHGVPHLLVIPCLVATLCLGPIGLLMYVVVRWFAVKMVEFDERVPAASQS